MMKTLLLTWFEPLLQFMNYKDEIVKSLNGKTIGDYEINGATLPVS